MRIAQITIQNFRGVKYAKLLLPRQAVLLGDNNAGKSTVLEAIDLVLGPERLHRPSPIDEHDFYAGEYLGQDKAPITIAIELVVVELSEEQLMHFFNNLEYWNTETNTLLDSPPPEATDGPNIAEALRLGFRGKYDPEEDNFICETFFVSPHCEEGKSDPFKIRDKRICGFLFLRTLRTGSRALSLERGSLLDVILQLRDLRSNMWEDFLSELRQIDIAENESFGISPVLNDLQASLQAFVPSDGGENPNIRVSELTREHLRKTLAVFIGTGAYTSNNNEYLAPFGHQGTGTINTLVLALLAMIAEEKQNVIFAMEEPEIALPPHVQRRIVDSIRSRSAQALFTSHSPYILDEFSPENLILIRRDKGIMEAIPATLPPSVKDKSYRNELRKRFCECLLARKILIVEGRTEYDAMTAAARHLSEIMPNIYRTLENLGIAVIDAETDSQIAPLGTYFKALGKTVYAIADRQDPTRSAEIRSAVDLFFESPESSFEKLILKHTEEKALLKFGLDAVSDGRWPQHLTAESPNESMSLPKIQNALRRFLEYKKGSGEAARLVRMCNESELPPFIKSTLRDIKNHCNPVTPEAVVAPEKSSSDPPIAYPATTLGAEVEV
jgi:putative ATP-dependent endonuclease of OLD family